MKKNIRVLVICENKKQTEKLYETYEKNVHNAYVDTCYYHGKEKAVMVEYSEEEASKSITGLGAAVITAQGMAEEAGVKIKDFIFESGW